MFQGEITGKRKPTDWNANYVGLASVSLLCNAEANQWELVLAFLISLWSLQGMMKSSHGIGQAIEDCCYDSLQLFFLLLAQRDQIPSWEALKLQTLLFLELKYLSLLGETD